MTGDELYNVLSSMNEDERKKCNFMWFTNDAFLRSIQDTIISNLIFDKHLYDSFKNKSDTEVKIFIDNLFYNLSADSVKSMGEGIEDEISEGTWDSVMDEVMGIYQSKIEEWLKNEMSKKGIELIEE